MNGNGREPRRVPTVRVVCGTGISISEDGTEAALEFELPDGDKFMLALPVERIASLGSMAAALATEARKRGIAPGNVAPRYPQSFSVGHTDRIRGAVALIFEPEMPNEEVFVLRDQSALQLIEAVEKDIKGRMPAAQFEALKRSAGRSGRILLPGLGG